EPEGQAQVLAFAVGVESVGCGGKLYVLASRGRIDSERHGQLTGPGRCEGTTEGEEGIDGWCASREAIRLHRAIRCGAWREAVHQREGGFLGLRRLRVPREHRTSDYPEDGECESERGDECSE